MIVERIDSPRFSAFLEVTCDLPRQPRLDQLPHHPKSTSTSPSVSHQPATLNKIVFVFQMITHDTLYALANGLGALAMVTVVAYHFVAVNSQLLSNNNSNGRQS